MLNKINKLSRYPAYNEILDCLRSGKHTAAFGVCKNEKYFIAGGLEGFPVYVAPDFVTAQETLRCLNDLTGGGFVYLPHNEDTLLFKQGTGRLRLEINAALDKIMSGARGVVLCADALAARYPFKAAFAAGRRAFKRGDIVSTAYLARFLSDDGFKRVPKVEKAGEFSIRGDIADIFPPDSDSPVRLDFFDDEIESIKIVDKETFRSGDELEQISLYPLFSVPKGAQQSDVAKKLQKSAAGQRLSPDARTRLVTVLDEILPELDNGTADNGWLMPFFPCSGLAEYLPTDAVMVWDEPKMLTDKLNRTYDEFFMRISNLLSVGEILPEHAEQLARRESVFSAFDAFNQLALMGLASADSFFRPTAAVSLKSTPLFNYKFNIRQLGEDIKRWKLNGYKVGVFCDDDARAERLAAALGEVDCPVTVSYGEPEELGENTIIAARLARGFVSHSNKLAIVGGDDVFSKPAGQSDRKLTKKRDKVFLSLEKGDYAVHEVHGIGLCDGVHTLTGSFGTKDFIKLLFRDGEAVYVPVENTDMLSKYGGSETAPRLSRLGGAEFEKVKSKVKSSLKAMAVDLIKLYAARRNSRGFSYKTDDYLDEEFAAAFPYAETEDQLKCIEEIDADLKSTRIMDRLLVGDVGFGKTEVAMRAAFKVVSNGFQAAFLAPTTILAEQHYNTLKQRMEHFDVRVGCLNRFRSAAEQKKIIKELSEGKLDIVVGTHRLLSKDVAFKNLGLLVLDEEQRFGVEDKEKLKVLKTGVDVLTMSATPIPRTLHMALTGMRDISTITTPPKERVAVESYVTVQSDALIRDIILREFNRQGQVFLVYNRVETIDLFAAGLKRLVPEVKIAVAHGQMNEEALENNIYKFSQGLFDVLVCSTIIENGIDMPNANTLVVCDADRLGLSQLYQLRGRVGRGSRLAFAYFLFKDGKILSETAYKRLCGIAEYSELGSGFKIAMKDLEIRGAGNVLGKEQHGHMQRVGYDMYVKLLNEAVGEIEGKPAERAVNTTVEAEADAFVTEDYIDKDNRMTLYQRLAGISGKEEAEKLADELREIYGEPPQEVKNLLEIALIKRFASDAGFDRVRVDKKGAELDFADKKYLSNPKLFEAMEKEKQFCRLDASKRLSVLFVFDGGNAAANLRRLKNFLQALS